MPASGRVAGDDPNIVLSPEFLTKRAGYRVPVARGGKPVLAAVPVRSGRGEGVAFRWCCPGQSVGQRDYFVERGKGDMLLLVSVGG